MKTCFVSMLSAMLVVGGLASVAAARWCTDYFPDAIFCDDFDRYCTNPPPNPEDACASGSQTSNGALQAVWSLSSTNPNGPCGTTFTVETDTRFYPTPPFAARYPCQGNAQLGQQTVDLTDEIRARIGPQYDAAEGSDDAPLILRFTISGGVAANYHLDRDTGYMELAMNDARAPMDWILVGADDGTGCIDCYHMCQGPHYSVHVPWPTVCQQYDPRTASPHCPPLQTNIRAALAVGANALLDNNPCHCENPAMQVPNNNHLCFYDGLKWRTLRAGQPWVVQGDFVFGPKYNDVIMVIRSTTVDITLTPRQEQPESRAVGIPRLYLGGFNRLRGGTGTGCQLNNGSYTCAGNTRCIRVGETRCDNGQFQSNEAANITFDAVALYGGQGTLLPGACCLPTGQCIDETGPVCQSLGGTFSGPATSCASTLCCPRPFADHDLDGDVDMTDFAVLQSCLSIGASPPGVSPDCACFDRDGDQAVGATDVEAFILCATGPGVQWNEALTPDCNP